MSVICNVIIPQIDPEVIDAIGNIGIGYFNAKLELAQNNMQQLEGLAQELAENALNAPSEWSIKLKLELASKKLEEFNEKVRVMLKTKAATFNKKVVNVYKKVVSCSRAVRSHKKTSVFSKSSSGDSGDSDQPEPPRQHPHLNSLPQRNRYSHSWQVTPGYCSMVGGGQI